MSRAEPRLTAWQAGTVALMVLGYVGYYVCRSNFSVGLPLIIAELKAKGADPERARAFLGLVASIGMLGYAAGKLPAGMLADFLGGKGVMLLGMVGSIACTVGFALGGGLPAFSAAWLLNRFFQSWGWPGMVKISSRWFAYSTYGTVMGVLSLSYLLGDAAARSFLGELIERGLGWRGMFFAAAGVLAVLLAVAALLLRESPGRLGLPEPPASPENVYGKAGSEAQPGGLGSLLGPLVRSPAFWLVCLLSLGLTLLRETFNTWTPTYFHEAAGLAPGRAARASALFPLFGAASVVLAGLLGDRLGRSGRAAIILVGLVLAGLAMAALGLVDFRGTAAGPVVLVTAAGFLLVGPYSYLAGALALDFGGKRGGATASALIDAVGYVGAVASGLGVARLSSALGWGSAFLALAGVAWLTGVAALVLLVLQRRAAPVPEP